MLVRHMDQRGSVGVVVAVEVRSERDRAADLGSNREGDHFHENERETQGVVGGLAADRDQDRRGKKGDRGFHWRIIMIIIALSMMEEGLMLMKIVSVRTKVVVPDIGHEIAKTGEANITKVRGIVTLTVTGHVTVTGRYLLRVIRVTALLRFVRKQGRRRYGVVDNPRSALGKNMPGQHLVIVNVIVSGQCLHGKKGHHLADEKRIIVTVSKSGQILI
mmetsp:Transcript_18152/g.29827  ORF Transcript_18152/g.29827 Transcript_18152/m.29827 type:complete len:218 (-) Transcript_18152:307-960(-)